MINGCVKVSQVETKLIDFKIGFDNYQSVNLSKLADTLLYIKLETDTNCLISEIDQIEADDNYIYVADKVESRLLQFTFDGNYNQDIGSVGKGPGEYINIRNMDISTNGDILILDEAGKLIFYSNDGKLKNQIYLAKAPWRAKWLTDDKIVLIYSYPFYNHNDGYSITIIDRSGRVSNNGIRHSRSNKIGRMGWNNLYWYNDTLNYWDYYEEYVIGISKDGKMTPRLKLPVYKSEVPKMIMRYGEVNSKENYNHFLTTNFHEYKNFKIINCLGNPISYRIIFNQKENKYININGAGKSMSGGFSDDIHNGFNYWPQKYSNNGYMIMIMDPIDFIEKYRNIGDKILRSPQGQKAILEIQKNSKLLDNPILILAK
jgi:hypothetical protein